MDELILSPPDSAELLKYQNWWDGLTESWRVAFNEVYQKKSTVDILTDELLHSIWNSPVMRFAGPKAMHPNMSFELTDLTGIAPLTSVTILIVINHSISSLEEIRHFNQLESLFIFNNKLTSIEPLSGFINLKELYIHNNDIESLKSLEKLTNLHSLYCNNNKISGLEGIGIQHEPKLTQLICRPNELLRDRVIMEFERETGIRCK